MKVSRKKYYENNKHKFHARYLVAKALKKGELTIKPCAFCSSTENVEAHHADYAKPLDVIWLCEACHKAEHKRLNREKWNHETV